MYLLPGELHRGLEEMALLAVVWNSGITDGGAGGRVTPRGKPNVKTGLPLADILIFSILWFSVGC